MQLSFIQEFRKIQAFLDSNDKESGLHSFSAGSIPPFGCAEIKKLVSDSNES